MSDIGVPSYTRVLEKVARRRRFPGNSTDWPEWLLCPLTLGDRAGPGLCAGLNAEFPLVPLSPKPIRVKKTSPEYTVSTFERSYDDEYVSVSFARNNGLDGKVSRIRINYRAQEEGEDVREQPPFCFSSTHRTRCAKDSVHCR